ncbi:MAG: hypothetical protein H6837_13105 [Planctomycetes bacterium]|nr:hypothetical protein [Planctomycetota bacterium]
MVRGAATLLLCQAKFTGVVYSAVLWITWATIEMVALKRIGWRETGGATLTLCVVAILSWYPYATNWCEHGHAFHPALGPHAQDILDYQTPAAFAECNRLTRFA